MTFALLALAAYLLGAIPVGVLVARARGVDILKEGSGNIGATNVGRVLGKGPGLAVWALDVMKSLVPTLVAQAMIHHRLGSLDAQTQGFLVGTAAILGHCASPFLGFKGGKGISTALGAMLGTAPLVALVCFGLFALVLWTTRYMAIASTVGGFVRGPRRLAPRGDAPAPAGLRPARVVRRVSPPVELPTAQGRNRAEV